MKCSMCNKKQEAIYLGMYCDIKNCIYVDPDYCGLEPFTSGKYDPFYESQACQQHDAHFEEDDVTPFKTALEFTVDVLNTTVKNTAKAAYSIIFTVPYIAIGAFGGYVWHKIKRMRK